MKEHFITLIALLFPREGIYVYSSWIQTYLLQKKYTTLLIMVDNLLNHFVDNLNQRNTVKLLIFGLHIYLTERG